MVAQQQEQTNSSLQKDQSLKAMLERKTSIVLEQQRERMSQAKLKNELAMQRARENENRIMAHRQAVISKQQKRS